MRLEDGDDARRPRLRRGEGGANLLAVVRVVVHDVDIARRRADQLEATRDAREAREQADHRIGVEADLERDQRGGGGVLEVVQPGLRNVQGRSRPPCRGERPGRAGSHADDAQARVGVLGHAVGRGLEPAAERRRLGAVRADEQCPQLRANAVN